MDQNSDLGKSVGIAEMNLHHPSLTFNRPVVDITVMRPLHLKLEKGNGLAMLWWSEETGAFKEYQVDALWHFCRLLDASDEQIYQFAATYGVLGLWPICRGDLMKSRQVFNGWQRDIAQFGEAVDVYRRLARRVRAILLVGALLIDNKTVPDLLWAEAISPDRYQLIVEERTERIEKYGPSFELGYLRRALVASLETWLNKVALHLQISWPDNETAPSVRLNGNSAYGIWPDSYYQESEKENWQGQDIRSDQSFLYCPMRPSRLFNIIVIDLAAALTSAKGIYRCDECGHPFEAEGRKPWAERDKLCSDACRKKRNAKRVAEHYKRKKEKKLLAEQ